MTKKDHIANIMTLRAHPSYLINRPRSQADLAEALLWLLERTPSDEELREMSESGVE